MEESIDMKKAVFMLLATLGVVVACHRENIVETEDVTESNAKTVTVYAGTAGTRTTLQETAPDQFTFSWNKDDKIAVIEAIPYVDYLVETHPDENIGDYVTALFYSEKLKADTDNAVFTLNLDDRPYVHGELQYIAVYPASCAWDTPGGCWNSDLGKAEIPIDFPREQRPSATSFDPNADVMVSKAVIRQDQRPETLSFQFARVGTIVKITLKGLPEGTVLTGGWVELGFEAGYYFQYDPAEEKIVLSDGTDGIGFQYLDGLPLDENKNAVIWLRTMSGRSDGSLQLSLEGKVNGEDRYWNRRVSFRARGTSLEFKEGGLTKLAIKMGTPDVENPEWESIDYKSTDNLEGVIVTWPGLNSSYLDGYECFLRDENGVKYEFNSVVKTDDGLYTATRFSGLPAGEYTFYVRAIAIDGKVSEPEFQEKEEIKVGVPSYIGISYVVANYSGDDNWGLSFPGSENVDTEDLYRGVVFYHRNMDWRGGSPNYFVGLGTYTKPWAIWNSTPVRWNRIRVKQHYFGASDFKVYASNNFFTGGVTADEQSWPYTVDSEGYRVYELGQLKYFLITGDENCALDDISLEYYK